MVDIEKNINIVAFKSLCLSCFKKQEVVILMLLNEEELKSRYVIVFDWEKRLILVDEDQSWSSYFLYLLSIYVDID